MFEWRIEVEIFQCQGIIHRPQVCYSWVIRMYDQMANSQTTLDPRHNSQSRLPFNTLVTLLFNTSKPQLPNNELQIILMMQRDGVSNKQEQKQVVIGISTVTVYYPLQDQLRKVNVFPFDKSLQKGSVKARIQVNLEEKKQEEKVYRLRGLGSRKMSRSLTMLKQASQSQLSSEEDKRSTAKHDLDISSIKSQETVGKRKYKQAIEALSSQRDQLYRISEELYTQLRQCTDQRDEYFQELREKMLSQEQTKEELEFLKLKLNEYQESHHLHSTAGSGNRQLLGQLEKLSKINEELREDKYKLEAMVEELKRVVEERGKKQGELQRQVRESLVALGEFRQQATQARSELIHKESQFSFLQARHLDPHECIQEIYKELEDRNYDNPFDFSHIRSQQYPMEEMFERLKKETAGLFVKLMGKMRMNKQKEWLLHQKLRFERILEDNIIKFSNTS